MQKHAQWKVGVKLWLDVFDKVSLRFESYAQIRELWLKPKSGTFYIKDVCTHTEYDKWWRKQTKSKRAKR
ncbi:hypothetical protein IQ209_04040 [Xenorhabdus sp. BG5]|nr:hypothetical protein [Xenorhabdus sp. BG5]